MTPALYARPGSVRLAWLTILILPALLNCVGSDALYDPPGGRGFWARKSDLNSTDWSFYRATAMFAASSANAEIYVEAKNGNSVPSASVDGLLAAFENNIVPIEHVWYTTPTDVDRSGKVILLLLDIQDGYREGSAGGYIAGYFDPINQFSEVSVNALDSKYHSNFGEMLYLDTYPADITSTSFFATLAHEYQHLLQFGKYYRGEQSDIEPTWIDEGLSEVTSDLTGFGPQRGRAQGLRTALLNKTSLIREPDRFLLDNYAMSYIYFRYLSDAYGIGAISAIFRDNQIGLPGVNTAIGGIDPALTTVCGNASGLTYPYFGCSYRFMWGALVRNVIGDAATGADVRYNSSTLTNLTAGATYTYKIDASNTKFAQDLTDTLANGSYGPISNQTTGALQSYAPMLFKVSAGLPAPNFQTCVACGLTLVGGMSYYVVFNHDANTAATRSATVVDSIQQNIVADPQAGASLIAEGAGEIPLEHRAMHWHFKMTPQVMDYLQKE